MDSFLSKRETRKLVRKKDKQGIDHYYDFSTSNKSFLKLAKTLNRLGVKNYYFMLEIYDPSIIDVDLFAVDKDGNTTLSKDTRDRVIQEIWRNPWYYLREVCRIPASGAPKGVPYIANRGNIAQAWCVLHDLDSWLNLPRQRGKTQSIIALQSWFYQFGTSNATFIFFNKDSKASKENLKRIKDQIELLPTFLQFKSYTSEEGKIVRGKDNATAMSHVISKNNIEIRYGVQSFEASVSAARGMSAQFIHYDEVEFTPNIIAVIDNSYATFSQAADIARKNGSHAARMFTSTPGDLDSGPGKESEILLEKTVKWYDWAWEDKATKKVHPALYDMTPAEIRAYEDAQGEGKMPVLYIEYSYKQLGYSEEWLNEESKNYTDKLTFRREVLLQRLHGSSLSPFDREDIEYIVSCEKAPIGELWINDYYKFDIYKELNPNIPYLVGIDCATCGGENSDNNAITIINPYTLEPDAEFECAYIGETKYEKLIVTLVTEYIPRACVIIERNSIGDGIIDHLIEGDSPIARNLYFDKNADLLGDKMKSHETVESMLKKEVSKKTHCGVYTSTKSRNDMMGILSKRIKEDKEKFVTHNITRDISRLIRSSSGKFVAGPGFHDDSIMSYLIAMYVYTYGTNLMAYGIYPGMGNGTGITEKKRYTINDVDPSLISSDVLEQLKKQSAFDEEQRRARANELRAYQESDIASRRLYNTGLINNQKYEPQTDADGIPIEDGFGEISMDFFKEMNDL